MSLLRSAGRRGVVRRCSGSVGTDADVVIVGGGIVGAAAARQLALRHPQLSLVLLEKETRLAAHQSGRNSGVVHAGVYYTPGSLKARLCVRGMQLAFKFFDEQSVPYERVGKLIVAVERQEDERLAALLERAKLNGVPDVQLVDGADIAAFEPHCRGRRAIWSPHTAIVDWAVVTEALARDFTRRGGAVRLGSRVTGFGRRADCARPIVVRCESSPPVACSHVICCAGLHADRVAQLSGGAAEPQIVPFRGEYLQLRPEFCHLVRGNIYPVPDARLPFLGVHLTRRIDGSVWLGPNAVLAFAREGYSYAQVNWLDLRQSLAFSGLRRLMRNHAAFGVGQLFRGVWKRAQVAQLRRFVPELRVGHVMRGPAGVRAQAVDADGCLVDDFVVDAGSGEFGGRILHVRNAPSPAATSSLAIAELIADRAQEQFDL